MKKITLKDIDVNIRRAKVKEVKGIIKDTATKVTEVADFIYNKPIEDDEFMESIPKFILDNIEFFEGYILRFTVGFSHEDFDNLEFLDAIQLIREILYYNGISEGFIKSFFHNFKKVSQEVQTSNEFIQEIPKA